ncbi:mechanosensitive ion channel family protein [Tenacibaculum maritimum]|uniref:mechanosensitive ion channel family protein n=1 Tax=Tenacibaculum maritimum TaxID=107401 RepID=UPI0012E5B805|nr:mechanosensitive ion channel domain-containing protein [Tenacibaculum maritimum]MCD9564059.1 mechanosensitive ion channel [Tenacibaculum maritimum]MCD9565565.1 mechanosensitive ion channel [Tenacibaculum maritimum]MCD9579188.1 mechanosensitive ion channel [Tenacibaculum maritimum]MCD9596088.1 mechanosensitive ion channel [Tenacibaculum maritimum]MCD9613337.1 mechanosensitive ion channel [Tenacibaculum maritimum]
MNVILKLLNYTFNLGKDIKISVKGIIVLFFVLYLTSILLKTIRRIVTKKLSEEDSLKFISVFSYVKYFLFVIVFLVALSNMGVNVTAIITGATALLIGVGLALQTVFQDIISGIIMLADQSVKVNDVIEFDNKTVKVTSITLRTTKAVTIDNKILVIPNHMYLTHTIYNWTQNNDDVRENVSVGVAYGSDTRLVESILLKVASENKEILKNPDPKVLFQEFGDSSLSFKLIFTTKKTLSNQYLKSDLHFEIDRLFREYDIKIPFPQRDLHIIKN